MNFNKLILDKTDDRLDKMRSEAHYIQDYLEEPSEYVKSQMDKDAWDFHNDFLPLFAKYVGTKQFLKCIKDYVKTHEITRRGIMRVFTEISAVEKDVRT